MVKRLFDILVSLTGLVILSPLLAGAAVGVRMSSPGPIFYRARRAGKDGKEFIMYKFRTMHTAPKGGWSAITTANDLRVFRFGSLLRKSKIDELPQLINVLLGEMSIVGPRPEDPEIVSNHYTASQMQTLSVRPGLASPGSIYNYTHGDIYLAGGDAEDRYVNELLPLKLALDMAYINRSSFIYDLSIITRTASIIALITLGMRKFPDPPEMPEARKLLGI